MGDDEFDAFDDIQLDEELLKALQDTENRYTLTPSSQLQSAAKPPLRPQAPPPQPTPPRAQKTAVSKPAKRNRDEGDLPDIILNSDGTYGVRRSSKPPLALRPVNTSAASIPPGTFIKHVAKPHAVPSFVGNTTLARPPPVGALAPAPSQSRLVSKPLNRTIPSSFNAASQARAGSQAGVLNAPSSSGRPGASKLVHNTLSARQVPPALGGGAAANDNTDVVLLKQQLYELHTSKDAAKKALDDMRNAQFIRDGEIATLRRTMEKQAATHAEALSKLKDEKTAAENRRAAIEREMNAEMDRLKTKLSFKQQEIETVNMRFSMGPPSTVRRPRLPRSSQPTPGPSRYSAGPYDRQDGSPSKVSRATPMNRRTAAYIGHSAKKSEPAHFPGFQDSFALRGVGKQSSQDKGKGRALEESIADVVPPPFSQHGNFDVNVQDLFIDSEPIILDYGADAEPEGRFSQIPDDPGGRWKFNWAEELYRLLFTHSAPPLVNRMPLLTIQLALSTAIPSEVDAHLQQSYVRACGDLMTVFGQFSGQNALLENGLEDSAYQELVTSVGSSLLQMVIVLCQSKQFLPLHGMLHLVKTLILSLPSFRAFFLATSLPPDSNFFLSSTLCDLIRGHTPPRDQYPRAIRLPDGMKDGDQLVIDVLEVMESLVWSVPEVLDHRLATIANDSKLLAHFLNPSQPLWLIYSTLQLIILLSTRSSLTQSFVGPFETSTPEGTLVLMHSFTHLTKPYPGASFVDSRRLIQSILTFLSNLSILHGQATTMLDSYPQFVPSLILCLADVSDRLWGEDDDFKEAGQEDHDVLIDVLVTALYLIHHLFYGIESNSQSSTSADIPHILQQAAALPSYNGLDHIYIVVMTRLGYADAPEWLGPDRIALIDDVAEMAREMLELFVGGPEADLIVSAYVTGEDELGEGAEEETQDEEAVRGDESMDVDE